MIRVSQSDILQADAEALVNTVNCVGVMGRGIALQFRKAFPENYRAYKAVCDRHGLQPGQMLVHDRGEQSRPRYIINFPTKRHWRNRSELADIASGLEALVGEIRQRGVRSVAIPPLGCGLGGLDWEQVQPLIEESLGALPEVEVLLFAPSAQASSSTQPPRTEAPKMTTGRAVLLRLMHSYLLPAMDPTISLLEIHKLMYFAQIAGEPLKLRYVKSYYGPYAENLRHVLSHLEGHFLRGYGEAEDRPGKEIELVPGVVEQAGEFLQSHATTQARLARVVELIRGFETPSSMELLASVHWVATQEGARSPEAACAKVQAWNPRKKRMFPARHIRIAWDALTDRGWLPQP